MMWRGERMKAWTALSLLPALFLLLHLAGTEGNAVDLTREVECSTGLFPGETCGARAPVRTLENTRWKLTRLGDTSVLVGERQREPHLIFEPEHHRVVGSGGCNRISGSYTLSNDQVRFNKLATTRMACADGMETEKDFLASLERARRWNILGEYLEFYDEEGGFLARLEAHR